jgi:hypothetical protein
VAIRIQTRLLTAVIVCIFERVWIRIVTQWQTRPGLVPPAPEADAGVVTWGVQSQLQCEQCPSARGLRVGGTRDLLPLERARALIAAPLSTVTFTGLTPDSHLLTQQSD